MLTTRSTAKSQDFLLKRLGIDEFPVKASSSRPACATLLLSPSGSTANSASEIVEELLNSLFPENCEADFDGCLVVMDPRSLTNNEAAMNLQRLNPKLAHVPASDLPPLAVRRMLLEPGPRLLTCSVRDSAHLDLSGVDIRLVVIPRLPFLPFSHPVQEEISSRLSTGRSGFLDYTLPESIATIQRLADLTQNSTTGKAVVILLDSRITEKRYGRDYMTKVSAHQTASPPVDRVVSTTLNWLKP